MRARRTQFPLTKIALAIWFLTSYGHYRYGGAFQAVSSLPFGQCRRQGSVRSRVCSTGFLASMQVLATTKTSSRRWWRSEEEKSSFMWEVQEAVARRQPNHKNPSIIQPSSGGQKTLSGFIYRFVSCVEVFGPDKGRSWERPLHNRGCSPTVRVLAIPECQSQMEFSQVRENARRCELNKRSSFLNSRRTC